jgi:hypothetical protein
MKVFADAYPTQVDILQRAMAAYFFQFEPKASSLYVRLAHRIHSFNWNGALASLNYERLLELSLQRVGVNVVVGQVAGGATKLCLPHGCSHLFGQIRTDGNIQFGPGIRLDGPWIRVIENPQEHADELQSSTVPPVMSYFQPDKQTRAGVSFIGGQRRRFAELVGGAQAVAIIGVKVRRNDRHIWEPLQDTSAKIIYCAGGPAGDEFTSWAADAGRSHDEVLPCYWEKAFDDLCLRVGIRAGT